MPRNPSAQSSDRGFLATDEVEGSIVEIRRYFLDLQSVCLQPKHRSQHHALDLALQGDLHSPDLHHSLFGKRLGVLQELVGRAIPSCPGPDLLHNRPCRHALLGVCLQTTPLFIRKPSVCVGSRFLLGVVHVGLVSRPELFAVLVLVVGVIPSFLLVRWPLLFFPTEGFFRLTCDLLYQIFIHTSVSFPVHSPIVIVTLFSLCGGAGDRQSRRASTGRVTDVCWRYLLGNVVE
mmetsp:Transcript_23559/g.42143  ORF Transcript_23559/g.42143 Transcript_23559/m.42143 type:complete len:233 (-) Transcript_23559:1089-1787(-)